MKLRTVVLVRHDGKYVLCVDKDAGLGPDEVAGEKEVIHDATAANALMMAMCQYESDFPLSAAAPQDVIQWIEKRADALLKQWGFDTGEGA